MTDDPLRDLRPHEAQNRRSWDEYSDEYQAMHAAQLAPTTTLSWGTWDIPEAELHVLGDVVDKDILEFGCGANGPEGACWCTRYPAITPQAGATCLCPACLAQAAI